MYKNYCLGNELVHSPEHPGGLGDTIVFLTKWAFLLNEISDDESFTIFFPLKYDNNQNEAENDLIDETSWLYRLSFLINKLKLKTPITFCFFNPISKYKYLIILRPNESKIISNHNFNIETEVNKFCFTVGNSIFNKLRELNLTYEELESLTEWNIPTYKKEYNINQEYFDVQIRNFDVQIKKSNTLSIILVHTSTQVPPFRSTLFQSCPIHERKLIGFSGWKSNFVFDRTINPYTGFDLSNITTMADELDYISTKFLWYITKAGYKLTETHILQKLEEYSSEPIYHYEQPSYSNNWDFSAEDRMRRSDLSLAEKFNSIINSKWIIGREGGILFLAATASIPYVLVIPSAITNKINYYYSLVVIIFVRLMYKAIFYKNIYFICEDSLKENTSFWIKKIDEVVKKNNTNGNWKSRIIEPIEFYEKNLPLYQAIQTAYQLITKNQFINHNLELSKQLTMHIQHMSESDLNFCDWSLAYV